MQINELKRKVRHRCGQGDLGDRSSDGIVAPTAGPLSWWLMDECEVASIVAQHAALRGLCNDLEDCADRLPDRAAIACAVEISAGFVDILRRHEIVEQAIFGTLLRSGAGSLLAGRIRHCHMVDCLHAEDLHDALTKAVRTIGPVEADALSYMMRCLFDGCRRGIDLQEAGVLLMMRNRLTNAARNALLASLTGSF